MYKILKNIIEMDDYSVQKLSNQPPEPFEWNTVEGTELNVSDCIGGKGKIEGKGNTYQKQLSGKNKFGVSERSEVVADVDCLFKDSEILINGAQTTGRSSSKLTFKDILPAGTYHIKPKVISGTCVNGSGGHSLSIVITDTNNTKLVDKWLDGLDMDFTLSEANQLKFSIWIPAGAQFNNYKVGIQIEEGSTATDYEPYTGGQPSPNPLYPQNIEVVTGNNVIRHVGKNEFYGGNINTIWYNSNSGKFTSSTTFKSFIMKVKPNTQYVISKKNASNRFAIVTSQSEPAVGNYYKRLVVGYNESNTSYAFKTENDENYILFGVYNGTDETEIAKAIEEIQLEEGSTPTQYEPYRGEDYNLNLGSIELCKIGNYQDTMFKNVAGDENYNAELEDGAWYKKSAIAEVVLDGKETWSYNSGNRYFYTNKFIDNYVTQYTKLVSNNYIGGIASNGGLYNNHIQTGTAYSFMLCDNRFTDKNDLKTWLSTHNTIVKYPLATPTYEKITNPTLISQLEALRKFKWFRGVNHIWTETDNLDPVLAGTYKQSIQSETQNSIANLQVQANEQSISNTPESEV